MSTTNMPNFFDNILDDAGPIGELPDLDQIPEFVDQESNLSPRGDNVQIPLGTGKKNSEGDLTDQYDRPLLVNPSNESVPDKFDGEVLSDGFPTFDFDTAIMERDEHDIAFESALNEADDIGNECENFRSDGDKRSGDVLNEADIHSNEHTNENRDPHACADLCCKENVPLVNGTVKRRKSAARNLKGAGNGPSPLRKARMEPLRNVMNPRVSDVTASSVTNRVPTSSGVNSRHSPSFQGSLGPDFIGLVHLNNAPAMDVQHQPLRATIPNNSGPIVPATYSKPPGLTLASHKHPVQERNALSPQDILSPASPLGMLPGDVRDQLLTQARRQSYATAEMRAIMMAQEAAGNMYRKASNGDAKINPASDDIPFSSGGMRGGQPVATQPVGQMVGADHSAASHIPPNASNHSRQPSLHAIPQRQVTSNQVPASSRMHATQMRAVSNNVPPQAVYFSGVSSADSHAKQMLFQQHPVAMGLPRHINNSNHKLPVNVNQGRSIDNNGLEQPFPQTASYPISDARLAAMNVVPTVGPSGLRRISKKARNSEVVAQTLANTYDQVNKLSATAIPDGKASRKSRLSREQMGAASSQEVTVSQHRPPQQVQPNAVASSAAPSTPAPTTPDPTSARLAAAAVRRQLSHSRNGPRLRFSKNAGPSKYCHICGRSASTVGVTVCGNLPLGLCRKVLCDKCLLIHEPEKLEMAKTKNSGWTCTHCRNVCPPKARCHQYTRNNQKRREKNDQKKRMKRKLQESQQEPENKRRRADSSEQLEEHGQGISPTSVPDGTFG